jgi:2-phospho-L-lactate guanylyltransferase
MIASRQPTTRTEEHSAMPQGTIKDFDIETGTGTLVQDDLVELSFDTQTFLDSRLEELRLGQRVRFRRDGDRVTDLQLVSL